MPDVYDLTWVCVIEVKRAAADVLFKCNLSSISVVNVSLQSFYEMAHTNLTYRN